MATFKELHNKAMDLAFFGDRENCAGNEPKAKEYYLKAFEAERQAAFEAKEQGNPEPGLSILFRSAASLALQCGELREAERIIAQALSGSPSKEVATELRTLLLEVYDANRIADDSSTLSYELQVPKSEAPVFETLTKRMGWLVSNIKGKIAIL